jgi:ABC-type phosphate transport system substrate-binding protein
LQVVGFVPWLKGELLAKEAIAANKRELPNGSQIVKIVSQIPGALGVVSASQVDASVAQIKTDKDLVQPLILVTKGGSICRSSSGY